MRQISDLKKKIENRNRSFSLWSPPKNSDPKKVHDIYAKEVGLPQLKSELKLLTHIL